VQAHWGSLIFALVNFIATIGAVVLVDKKGRKFLLALGSAGIIASLICVGIIFRNTETQRIDCKEAVQALVTPDQKLSLAYTDETARKLLPSESNAGPNGPRPTTLIVTYSYGDFTAATPVARSDDKSAKALEITRDSCVPGNKTVAFFSNPFANFDAAANAPLKIENALIIPSQPAERFSDGGLPVFVMAFSPSARGSASGWRFRN